MDKKELEKRFDFIEDAIHNELAIVRQNDLIISLLNEISEKLNK